LEFTLKRVVRNVKPIIGSFLQFKVYNQGINSAKQAKARTPTTGGNIDMSQATRQIQSVFVNPCIGLAVLLSTACAFGASARWDSEGSRLCTSVAHRAVQDAVQERKSHESQQKRKRQQISKLHAVARKLRPLHQPMGQIEPGDWLASHPELGQSFRQYLNSRPIRVTNDRKVLYVLPLGDFNEHEKKILDLSTQYLGLYFDCKVEQMDSISIDEVIPPEARRIHPTWGVKQIKSIYILEEVLPPRVPPDGVALICFTTSDLYPDEKWNFVFGQAMLQGRVGVWSMNRHGDAEKEYDRCLRRTLKVATHETGHMFSMNHCIAYECNMCGTNSLEESDRRPLYPCAECEAKISFATNSETVRRLKKLREFCEQHKLKDESQYYSKAIELLEKK
jgi:archaemetzincin